MVRTTFAFARVSRPVSWSLKSAGEPNVRPGMNEVSNQPLGVFGDQAVAAAMIDRILHHADVLTYKGATYRLRGRGIDTLPSIRTTTDEAET